MKQIAKIFLMICLFCPVLSAEPNQASGRTVTDQNALMQQRNLQQNERRQQRLRRRNNLLADANQQADGGKEFAQRRIAREKQISEELFKNKRRIAVLMRIKELAEATNQPEKAQKAVSLMQMENQRHRQKIIKLQIRSAIPANRLEKTEPNNK